MAGDRKLKSGRLLLEKLLLFCGALLFLWNISALVGVHAQSQKPKKTTPAPVTSVPVKFHENHRPIQWCVNGVDEPEFQKYPWSEFRPILQRKYYDHFLANVRFKYTIGLWPIMINSTTKDIGSGGNLYQRAHFTFKSELRKTFEEGVRLNFNNTDIEGLLVQANFAPYGVGLPFGQFLHPKEFNCVDCKAPVGIPIACRRRTYMHVVHPTVFAFHYNMKVPPQEAYRRREGCFNKVVPMQCIITDFKETDSNTSAYTSAWTWANTYGQNLHQPPPGMSSTCQYDDECDDLFKSWFSSDCCLVKNGGMCINNMTTPGTGGPMVKQFCPNVQTPPGEEISEDPYLQSMDWPKFECKPYEVTVCRKDGEPRVPAYDSLDDLQVDHTTGQPYPPGTGAPPGFNPFSKAEQCCLGAASGAASCPTLAQGAPPQGAKVCPAGFECIPRVVPPINREPTPWVEVFPGQVEGDKCGDILKEDYFGRTDIVHGNFVWYLPPCRGTTTRARFLMMVVHSFQKGIYSIVESEDYYELKSGAGSGSTKLNPHIPSPLFTGFPHVCEVPSTAQYLYSTTNQNEGFDYSRSYDECVQNTTGPRHVNDQICNRVPEFVPDTGRKKKGQKEQAGKVDKSPFPKCDGNAAKKPLSCEFRCPGLPSTTPEYIYIPKATVIKRTLHGGINIVTNFCIMPICVFIARFYKETFNLHGYKGQKTWYWMHMIGAGGSTVLQYMGYFTGKLVDDSDAHLVYGNIYIICLGLSYITSWMRHKNRWISMIVESTHSVMGYCCFLLALVCVTNAKQQGEPISQAVKYVVYVAIASLTVFYVGMTVHICSLDKKFGMKPKRWHFPSVEARFDDLPVPGRNVRKVFLFVVLFINLPLTLSTLFL